MCVGMCVHPCVCMCACMCEWINSLQDVWKTVFEETKRITTLIKLYEYEDNECLRNVCSADYKTQANKRNTKIELACILDCQLCICCVLRHIYVRQVNGVKLADILFSLLSVCMSVNTHNANISKTV